MLISPTLAATIGLEEAVMLHVLSELLIRHDCVYRDGRCWAELGRRALAGAMPFWQAGDIQRVQRNLQEKGLILVEGTGRDNCLRVAINQKEDAPAPAAPAPRPARENIFRTGQGGEASLIPPHWQPGEDLYRQCLQYDIPREFVEQRVQSFVTYQRERRKPQYSWHHTFLKYIIREWRNEQSYQGARENEVPMSRDWRPSEDACSILEHGGISRAFIEDAVPEFVLYWRERGIASSTWNPRFINHVRRQWERYTTAIGNDATPRPIPADYQPSAACLEILDMANIDLDFARAQVPEFVLYWRDRGEACPSWDTRLLQHVKYKWAHRQPGSAAGDRQLDDTIDRLTDRSWAE